MHDREFCDRTAAWAAEVVQHRFAHLSRGAAEYSSFGAGVVLLFSNDGDPSPLDGHPVVAKLREFFAIEEVGLRELGLGASADHRSWALLVEGRRNADYCRRLIAKAHRESLASASRCARETRGG